MDPNLIPLHAGIAGANMECPEFHLGDGVLLRSTYAHLMAPYLAAFARPAHRGAAHPAPWKAVSGGIAHDVFIELLVPVAFAPPAWFDRLNTIWWVVALLRMKTLVPLRVPVIANVSFAEMATMSTEPKFWPMEMQQTRLPPAAAERNSLALDDLDWLRAHWRQGGQLMREHDAFNFAFQSIDEAPFHRSPAVALVAVWAGLERLFSPSMTELSFRVSAYIAAYLEDRGEGRKDAFRAIKKLYDSRSRAAHGGGAIEVQAYRDSYALLRRVLIRMIESSVVPKRSDLDGILFG